MENSHINKRIKNILFSFIMSVKRRSFQYGHFTQSYLKRFKKEAAEVLANIDRIISYKQYKDYADSYQKDMNSLYRNTGAYTNDIPKNWMNTYVALTSDLAEIMSGLYRATHGKADEVRAEVASFVS